MSTVEIAASKNAVTVETGGNAMAVAASGNSATVQAVGIVIVYPSLEGAIVAASEQITPSYPAQVIDQVLTPTRKYASLDGSWILDGTYYLAPQAAGDGQMGWWGSSLAGDGGVFAEPYPALTTTFDFRPIRGLKVVGDSARQEYPVDFEIKLYDASNTLLHTEAVTGNSAVTWAKELSLSINQAKKMTLEISKWSHAGRQVKILEEGYSSIQAA